ncbi:hypothetical protein ACFORJ_06890 [Corynebacterium hansenii]|uniref:DUF3558 domain-containing protein n=1 Tax=Corynebacterium hansenii TaxID=394964 RepID=A0ABV7ZP06_9CORY|nr:hypothetical protein [Corynebacterium hansenii]
MRRALAGRWRARGATATALAVAAAATLGMAGCGAVGTDDANAATAGKETGKNALAPGVLPPNDPPQPGDARLGPDGHYDYSAPDFVLKNPCDTDAYGVALEKGWEPPVIGKQNFDAETDRMCGIVKGSDGIGITLHAFNRADLKGMDPDFAIQNNGNVSWYTTVWPNYIGSSCFAGIDLPSGAEGVTVPIGGFSNFSTRESACKFASDQFIQFFGGKHGL